MDYYYINTNAKYLGPDTYKVWLKHNRAFTNGELKYGNLGRLQLHDICFMYVSEQGVRAAGEVLEPWNRKEYKRPIILSPPGENEYRIRVDWFIALNEPIPHSELKRIIGSAPTGPSVQHIPNRKAPEKLLRTMQQMSLPEEVNPFYKYREGTTFSITINAYERNRKAREECLQHYGTCCSVCGFSFEATYGEVAQGYIHVHHLVPLSEIGTEYEVDPIKDLRPVCPNCHVVIHQRRPPYTPEEVKAFVTKYEKHS